MGAPPILSPLQLDKNILGNTLYFILYVFAVKTALSGSAVKNLHLLIVTRSMT